MLRLYYLTDRLRFCFGFLGVLDGFAVIWKRYCALLGYIGRINLFGDGMCEVEDELLGPVVIREDFHLVVLVVQEEIGIGVFHLVDGLFGIADHTDLSIESLL